MGGGTVAAISAMSGSGMTPGPLGIDETSPSAEAPARMAAWASSTLEMQQILMRGMLLASMGGPTTPRGR